MTQDDQRNSGAERHGNQGRNKEINNEYSVDS
jgi:hypothetical protein